MRTRILLADPDAVLRENYRENLERSGFEVVTAATALECVVRLRDCSPDLLVLEPSIPWGWGDGVLAVMREDPAISVVPVIVLTHGYDRGLLYRMARYRIDDFQTKPLSGRRLIRRIEAVLASREKVGIALSGRQSCQEAKVFGAT
jgi:two-component system phosphate regulon response regulator PhoB